MKKIIFTFLLFLFYVSNSCTEKIPCTDGLSLLKLIVANFDRKNNICLTKEEQLEQVSEEMELLECDSFINDSLKFLYGSYLCSQYNVKHEMTFSSNLLENTEKEVDITINDLVTENYIKGLDLLSQVCFSYSKSFVDYSPKFIEYLKRLKIDKKSIRKCIEKFELKIDLLEEQKDIEANEVAHYGSQRKNVEMQQGLDSTISICNALKKIGNENILDGFLVSQWRLSNFRHKKSFILKIIEHWKHSKETLSDYRKYLYSFVLDDKKVPGKGLRKTFPSIESHNYLLSRLENNNAFKNKYVEHLFCYRIAVSYKFFKKFKEAIPYYERTLDYEFDGEAAYDLSNMYFELTDYKKALEIFKQAKDRLNLSDTDKKFLNQRHLYHLSLLEKTGNQKEYDTLLADHNTEVLNNRLKNNRPLMKKAKKYLKLIQQEEKNRLENQSKLLVPIPQVKTPKKEKSYYVFVDYAIENQKKNYINSPLPNKKKTRGIGADIAVVDILPDRVVKNPIIQTEKFNKGDHLKIFHKLFGPYENPPIMDKHIKIHPDEIELLFKTLGFPFSRSDGKGSHRKGRLSFINDENKSIEQMIIIPVHRADVGPHYIRSLRNSFIKIGLYPRILKEKLPIISYNKN